MICKEKQIIILVTILISITLVLPVQGQYSNEVNYQSINGEHNNPRKQFTLDQIFHTAKDDFRTISSYEDGIYLINQVYYELTINGHIKNMSVPVQSYRIQKQYNSTQSNNSQFLNLLKITN